MKESEIISSLSSSSESSKKLLAIEELRNQVSVTSSLHIANIPILFSRIKSLLIEQSNSVVYATTQLLIDLSPQFRAPDISSEFIRCLPCVISNLGHPKQPIRHASLLLLQKIITFASNLVIAEVVKGMVTDTYRVRKECVDAVIPLMEMLRDSNAILNLDFNLLIPSLVGRLRDVSPGIIQSSAAALGHLRKVAPEQLKTSLKSLNPVQNQLYDMFKDKFEIALSNRSEFLESSSVESRFSTRGSVSSNTNSFRLEFGFLDQTIIEKVKSEDWKTRAVGIEYLQRVLSNMDDMSPLLPFQCNFFDLLLSLASDANFKISLVALNVIDDTLGKLGSLLERNTADMLANSVLTTLADSKTIIRQASMKIFQSIASIFSADFVIMIALSHTADESTRIREESVNLIISMLLQHPDSQFDFDYICQALALCLSDSRPRIRFVTLEALFVIGQRFPHLQESLGSSLSKDQMELVQKRRKYPQQGPKLLVDGLVEHGTESYAPTPTVRSRSISSVSATADKTRSKTPAEKLNDGLQNLRSVIDRKPSLPPLSRGSNIVSSRTEPSFSDFEDSELKSQSLKRATLASTNQRAGLSSSFNGKSSVSSLSTSSRSDAKEASLEEALNSLSMNNSLTRRKTDFVVSHRNSEAGSAIRGVKSRAVSESTERRKSKATKSLTGQINNKLSVEMLIGAIKIDDWESKANGFDDLVKGLSDTEQRDDLKRLLPPQLHEISMLIVKEIQNLRTQVCRSSIACLRALYESVPKAMLTTGSVQSDFELTMLALLKKTGDPTAKDNFMAAELRSTISASLEHVAVVNATKYLQIVLQCGYHDHKNPIIRTNIAFILERLISDYIGDLRGILQSQGNKLAAVIARLLRDGTPDTRSHAKKTLLHIKNAQNEWPKLLEKCALGSRKDVETIKECWGTVSAPSTLTRRSTIK